MCLGNGQFCDLELPELSRLKTPTSLKVNCSGLWKGRGGGGGGCRGGEGRADGPVAKRLWFFHWSLAAGGGGGVEGNGFDSGDCHLEVESPSEGSLLSQHVWDLLGKWCMYVWGGWGVGGVCVCMCVYVCVCVCMCVRARVWKGWSKFVGLAEVGGGRGWVNNCFLKSTDSGVFLPIK